MIQLQNLLTNLPEPAVNEAFETLLQTPQVRIERIVSHAHATPAGEWYDQVQHEWVVLLQGSAGLRIEGQQVLHLVAGDSVDLPAHCRHRVEWTDAEQPTVWLAVHIAMA